MSRYRAESNAPETFSSADSRCAWHRIGLVPATALLVLVLMESREATAGIVLGGGCEAVLDDLLSDGADGASAVRGVTFGPTGAVFDAATDGIDYPPSLFPAEGTIEFVLRGSATPDGVFILDTRGIEGRVIGDSALWVDTSGLVRFVIDPTGGQNPADVPGVVSQSPVDDGSFHCVAVSYGSLGLAIYVDGVLEATNVEQTTPLVRSTISLGDHLDGLGQSFAGTIFRVRTSQVQNDPCISGCFPALLDCQGVDGENGLFVNADNGVSTGHTVSITHDLPLHLALQRPAAGGNGKFVVHLNAGAPDENTVTILPASLGPFCHPILVPPFGTASPSAVWNNIGKGAKIGTSDYFGTQIADPARAPVTFLDLPAGDTVHFPVGSKWTVQGAIVNPAASNPKGVSVTNAIVIVVD